MTQPSEKPVHDSTQSLPVIGGDEPKAAFSLPSSEVSEPLSGGRPAAPAPREDAVPIVGQSYTVDSAPPSPVSMPISGPPVSAFPVSGPGNAFPTSGPAMHGPQMGTPPQSAPPHGFGGGMPPQPPTHGYQQQYFTPPPKSGNGKVIALVAIAAVVVLGGGLGLMAAIGGDDDGDSGNSGSDTGLSSDPSSVVEPLVTAMEEGDADAYESLLCSEKKEDLSGELSQLSAGNQFSLKIDVGEPETEKINDEEYTVTVDAAVEIEYAGDTINDDYIVTLDVIAEDDEWKICGIDQEIK
ncbi:MAG: hypothetical protein HOQ05_02100 [Corynebacteriales bacterium]|nr:hypothetical protein [Mycobacteriales bacterium]